MILLGKMAIVIVWSLIVIIITAIVSGCSTAKPEPQRDFGPKRKRTLYADTPSTFSSGYYLHCPHHGGHPQAR